MCVQVEASTNIRMQSPGSLCMWLVLSCRAEMFQDSARQRTQPNTSSSEHGALLSAPICTALDLGGESTVCIYVRPDVRTFEDCRRVPACERWSVKCALLAVTHVRLT